MKRIAARDKNIWPISSVAIGIAQQVDIRITSPSDAAVIRVAGKYLGVGKASWGLIPYSGKIALGCNGYGRIKNPGAICSATINEYWAR